MLIVALLAMTLGGSAPGVGPVSPKLRSECRSTARTVGYPVPCPTRLPAGTWVLEGALKGGCGPALVAPAAGRCGPGWRGWVLGSALVGSAHVVIAASPRPLVGAARLVDGPAWEPRATVRPLRSLVIAGRRMRAVFVPGAANAGSAFMNHVALVWTEHGHTYGIGASDPRGIAASLRLDVTLARRLVLTPP